MVRTNGPLDARNRAAEQPAIVRTRSTDASATRPAIELRIPTAPASLPRILERTKPITTASGFMNRIGELFRRHRASTAAVMAGITFVPGMVGAAMAPAHADPVPSPDSGSAFVERAPTQPSAAERFNVINVPVRANDFTTVRTAEEKLAMLKAKAGAIEDQKAAMSAADLKTARENLYYDYVSGGGTIGVEAAPNTASVARRIAFGEPTRDINAGNVTEFSLFKYFWTTEGDSGVGLARHGLDEVTPAGVSKLVAYAKTHDLDGNVKTAGAGRIDPDQRAVMKTILDHPHYGTFVELDARPALLKAFGIDPGSVQAPHESLRPMKAGDITIPSVTTAGESLKFMSHDALPKAMADEYKSRKSFFEDRTASVEVRGQRALGLLKDYASALWASGEQPDSEIAGNQLLDAFVKLPYADVYGTKDFNGAGWNVAQSLVLGLDPSAFPTKFPNAGANAETTYLSMDGSMAKSMAFVDQYREAKGLPKAAAAFEEKSPLGWMIGEEAGHKKAGNLDEQHPFASSGLNWGILLFPGDAEVKSLPPKEGFEFPIDAIDGFNNAVVAKPAWGDKLVVKDAAGHTLRVEKQIQKDAAGKPVSWSAVFKDANGHEVDPSTVLGLIVNAQGQVKGDGKATRSLDMWWWGFCDRNTAQRLYKSKYNIPQLDQDVKIVENGKVIVIPKEDAQKLVDMDMPDLVTSQTMEGFRFNDEPQRIKMKNGEVIEAHIQDLALDAGPGTKRVGGDLIAIHDAPGRPMLGTIEITTEDGAKPQGFDVRSIDSISKAADGKVTVKMSDDFEGWPKEATGKLLTSVPWNKAHNDHGTLVLKQNKDFPIRGGFTLNLGDGSTSRVNASDVSEIVGETMKDIRISQFTVWAVQNDGMFATDSSPGVVVSNGMRWVNRVDITEHKDDARPDWAPKKANLLGIQGELHRTRGDKMLWIRTLYAPAKDSEPTSSLYEGWVQLDAKGRILNEGFTSGQPDFGWSGAGNLDWSKGSSFNPYMDPEMRLKIFVNGVSDHAKLKALSDAGNLPQGWESFLTAR